MHRDVHRSAADTWLLRAACGAMVLAAILLALRHPSQGTAPAADHGDVCLALLVVRDALFVDRVPPPDATPEQIQAIADANADLAFGRQRLFALDGIRQLGCQERGASHR